MRLLREDAEKETGFPQIWVKPAQGALRLDFATDADRARWLELDDQRAEFRRYQYAMNEALAESGFEAV